MASAAPTPTRPSFFAKAWRILVRGGERFLESEAPRLGASFAYYALFSFFPLLLLAVTIFGYSLGEGEKVRRAFLDTVGSGLNAEARTLIDEALVAIQGSREARGPAAAFGVLGLFWGASAVFSELDTALNRIFRVPPPPPAPTTWHAILASLRDRIFAVLIMAIVGLLFFASFIASLVLDVLERHFAALYVVSTVLEVGAIVTSFVLLTISVAALFRFVPRRPVPFRYNLVGAALSTLAFSAVRSVYAGYLSRFTSYALYGAVGAFLGFALWTYFTALILFAGAQLAQALAVPEDTPVSVRRPTSAPPASQKASPAAK
jgi:membrane protein